MKKETRIITAALPFANSIPHLGNIIGSHLPADIFARYCRLKEYETIFVGGTDEHGTAIEFAALKENITPKEICDKLYFKHKEIYNEFGISYDNFYRTSDITHHKLVQNFFLNLYYNGFITEKEIEIPFNIDTNKSLADRYITGICPHCNYVGANGDQCEKCGSVLNPKELIEPYCSVTKSKNIEFRKTKHLFLDLRSITNKIENWIDINQNIRSQVKNLAKGWLKQGIEERCISRDLSWGVKIPLKGYEHKVFYVWFDNVIGYISATVDLLGEKGFDLWKDKNVKNYYFLGKDNIPFHTIFWPGQIIGEKTFNLPYNVVGYQYLNFEGNKFSKSKGIGIFADKVVENKLPIDYWRFYLTYILPEQKDTDFSLNDFRDRINKELIGNYGNLVNRSLNLIWNKFDGKLPKIEKQDIELEIQIITQIKKIELLYEKCNLKEALLEILKLSDIGNKYLHEKEPWKTNNSDVLNYSYEIIRIITILISPILVNKCKEIFELLSTENRDLKINSESKIIKKLEIVFQKIEENDLDEFFK